MTDFIRAYFTNNSVIPDRIYIHCAKGHIYTERECGMYSTNYRDYDVMLTCAEVIEILINS